MPGTTTSLRGDASQAAKSQGEGSLQAGEVFEVGGEPLETSSALHCGHLPLSAFLLSFFFFFRPTASCLKLFL